jgi:uncharacterized protein (TIGR02266 family)
MTTSAASAKTVLVADDTAFVRDRFKTALEGAGHRAVTVKSAAELLARVRADLAQLDLLVIDLRLPHANGVDLVRSIRKLDEGSLPILIFSGTITSAEEVKELGALGVAGYVNEYSAYRFGNTIAAALTLNLSRGGIAIRTTSPLENNAKVRIRFRLPGSKRDIDAEGRVAWSDRRHGMGLQFEKVEPQDQTAIDEFVDAHFFSSRKV